MSNIPFDPEQDRLVYQSTIFPDQQPKHEAARGFRLASFAPHRNPTKNEKRKMKKMMGSRWLKKFNKEVRRGG